MICMRIYRFEMPQRLDIPRLLERCLACEAEGSPPMERCLACEAEGVATRGALPRLRGRRGRHPWSVASLARPW
jgi:hypothetical protein